MTKSKEIDDGRIYTIGRICIDGADVGAVYAASVPCDTGALIAEVVGNRVRLRRGRVMDEARVDLSTAEVVALAAACRAWESARAGFTASQLQVKRHPYAGGLVEPADPSTVFSRRSVPARAVESEVMLVAELRIVEGRLHVGELAGVVYAMPNDWSLEVRQHRATLMRGEAGLVLDARDARFVCALARTLVVQAGAAKRAPEVRIHGAVAAPPSPAPVHKTSSQMTDEEIAEAFTIPETT